MFISYAQNFEDVILWRALKHVQRGFYLDIGAQDPIKDSVSLGFYANGWRGVHVEASADYAERLRQARPDEEVLEVAIGRTEGEIEFFEIAGSGLSTGDESIAKDHEAQGWQIKSRRVACRPLATVLDRYQETPIHWLKIDVEGMEAAVIDGWLPSLVRPWVVVIESTRPSSTELNYDAWEPSLLALGYEFVYFDKLNRFYVSSEHLELKDYFDVGPNVFDGFCLADTSDFFPQDTDTGHAKLAALERSARSALDEQLVAEREAREALTRQLEAAAEIRALAEQRADEQEVARIEAERLFSEAEPKRFAAEERLLQERAEWAVFRVQLEEQMLSAQEWGVALEQQIHALRSSRSWRMTRPIRGVGYAARWFSAGTMAWIAFKPGSRPRRILRAATISLSQHALRRPVLAGPARFFVSILPLSIRDRLRSIVQSNPISVKELQPLHELDDLSKRARTFYLALTEAQYSVRDL